MNSLLVAIAMLCNIGAGNAYRITVENYQQKCQKELATCALKDGWNGASEKKIMECLRDRK